ncbi:hypothetical protein LB543_01285 [Mesorhizobium sp. ESP7-2]|uniref:hypothetical protein n=1 Tax=Mesorhizobium sp. ESP7-2 TaxID=2876622 RepID=UPI001CC9D604|nr:hypothetical protein [Mesorhizobium sp. ESP7-2]MBZ9705362.1 hypothetical protein [Mesorhizobium sp. ESP7-2]
MARANIDAAVTDLTSLHASNFGGKRMGRFRVDREQVAALLRVKVAQDKTIRLLSEAALNDADLVFSQCGNGLYSVVAARKATRWRKVPRVVLADLVELETDVLLPNDDEAEDGDS